MAVNDVLRKKERAEKREIVREVPQPSGQPNISHFLPNLCDAAKFQHRLPSSLRLRQARTRQLIYSAIDVVLQFTIEVTLQVSPPEPVQ